MGIISGIWLIILGVVGILAGLHPLKRPDGAGWVLVVFILLMAPISGLWGVWGLISSLLNVGMLSTWPLWWVTMLMAAFAQCFVGVLGTVRAIQFIAAVAKPDFGKALLALSGVAVVLGVWSIVAAFLFA